MCTSSYWRKYQFGSFIQCRNTTFRCTTLNHLRVNIKHFLGPILGAEVAQKRAPFPQSRFSFDCKRMDSVASIRHESNTERISKSAYLRRFQQSRFEHFTWCLRGLYAQKENSREDVAEVVGVVKEWRELADRQGISKREMDMFSGVLDERYKQYVSIVSHRWHPSLTPETWCAYRIILKSGFLKSL